MRRREGRRHRSSSTLPAAIYTLVMLLVLAGLWVVFAQVRFGETATYTAEFTDVSGLKTGETVRVHGVEVGRVDSVEFAPAVPSSSSSSDTRTDTDTDTGTSTATGVEADAGSIAGAATGAPTVTVRFSINDDFRPTTPPVRPCASSTSSGTGISN